MPSGLMMFDYAGTFRQARDQAKEAKRVDGLRGLMGDYYGQQDPMLGGIAKLGGDAAGMQRDMQGQQDRQREQVGQFAALLVNAPEAMRPGLYKRIQPQLTAMGLEAPPEYTPEIDGLAQQIATQFGNRGQGVPAGLMEFNALSQGLSPEDKLKAQRVKLGLDGRAPSGLPFGFMEVVGSDGVTRIIQTNKAEGGAAMIGPGGQAYGAGAGQPPAQGNAEQVIAVANQMAAAGIPPQYIEQWMSKQPGMSPAAPAPVTPASGANPFESRRPEDQAALTTAATEQAKIDAQVGNAPRVAGAEAGVAAAKAKAEADAKAAAERRAKLAVRDQNAGTTLDLLAEAETLLPGATGSGLGAARDSGAALIGQSTPGAQNAAALKTISGQLILMQPRMEGPQSDADRKLYAQMAGDLGNESLPVATRMAALRRMKAIAEKYAGRKAAAPAAPKRMKYNPATGRIE